MKKILASFAILAISTNISFSSDWENTIDNNNIATIRVGDLDKEDYSFITEKMNPKTKVCFDTVISASEKDVEIKFNAKGVFEYVDFIGDNIEVECNGNKVIIDGEVKKVIK